MAARRAAMSIPDTAATVQVIGERIASIGMLWICSTNTNTKVARNVCTALFIAGLFDM